MRSKIEQAIGREAMRKLIAEFGGTQVYIPRTPHLDESDVALVRQLKDDGATVGAIARRMGVTSRLIYRILR